MGLKSVTPSSLQRISMIARQMKVSRIIDSPAKQRVFIPGGFAYGAFNGAAEIKPWSLLRMVETSRAATFSLCENETSFIDAHILYENYFFFIVSSTLQVNKEFYDPFVKSPVTTNVELEHIGNTSFQLKVSAFVNDFPEPMFVSRSKSILMCNKSRKPKAPPNWWKEKYSKEISAEVNLLERLEKRGGSDGDFTESQFTVSAADIDGYLHTNWANYVKYCYSALAEQIIGKGHVTHSGDLFRKLSSLSIVFKRESSIGDLLTVRVCPDENDPDAFYFIISKGTDISCECKMIFFP